MWVVCRVPEVDEFLAGLIICDKETAIMSKKMAQATQ